MEFEINTYKRCALVPITREVREAAAKSGITDGSVTVYCPHTTAGITINENADPDVVVDILAGLDAIVPKLPYAHAEGNSDAHIKASLVGSSVTIPLVDGELALGVWQGVYFCEFDGPRRRNFIVTFHG